MAEAPRQGRVPALLEVALATGLAHFTYKALKLAEPPGSNLSPGLTLLAFAVVRIGIRRPRAIAFGVRPFPRARAVVLAAALTGLAVAVALARAVPVATIGRVLLERLILAGFAEELFFRGYVQSRLDGVFGCPWRAAGAALGPGVVIAATLFGAIHLLNPTLWFHGRIDFDPGWGASAFASGLAFGWLRARSGGIWLPAFAHGFLDVARRFWIP